MKRFFDIFVAVAACLVLALPMLLVAILVKLTSRGPVLYWSDRVGQDNRIFSMPKFRSMKTGTPAVATHLLADSGSHLTPIGGLLRKTSLDELPQLFNVLRGEMSLVGPRPLPLYEVEQFHNVSHRRRLSMKPGLTCIWQVRGRNNVTSFDDWVQMDLEYIDHWSLSLDFGILLKTVPAVLLGSGAK